MNLTPTQLKTLVEHVAEMCGCELVQWYEHGKWFAIDGSKENMEFFKKRLKYLLGSV
jgi:hypothetical protein